MENCPLRPKIQVYFPDLLKGCSPRALVTVMFPPVSVGILEGLADAAHVVRTRTPNKQIAYNIGLPAIMAQMLLVSAPLKWKQNIRILIGS